MSASSAFQHGLKVEQNRSALTDFNVKLCSSGQVRVGVERHSSPLQALFGATRSSACSSIHALSYPKLFSHILNISFFVVSILFLFVASIAGYLAASPHFNVNALQS